MTGDTGTSRGEEGGAEAEERKPGDPDALAVVLKYNFVLLYVATCLHQ